MMIRRLHRCFGDNRGVATVEFALWSVFIFLALIPALDIGGFIVQRSRMDEAVHGAAIAAFASHDNVAFANLAPYVRAGALAPTGTTVAVTLGCNGGTDNCVNNARICACLSRTGAYSSASCGSPCSGGSPGSTAGYYLSIRGSYPYTPMVLPRGALNGGVIARAMTVRLQ